MKNKYRDQTGIQKLRPGNPVPKHGTNPVPGGPSTTGSGSIKKLKVRNFKKNRFKVHLVAGDQRDPQGLASTDPSNVNQSEAEPSPSIPRAYDYSWILRVLQPGKKLYDGHGVARPSAFVGGSGQKFIHDLEMVMNDRGGPGSWMWKKLPKLTQGLPRPPGGAAAMLRGSDDGSSGFRETLVAKREREAAAKAEQRKRQAKEQRLADLRDEFRTESRQGASGSIFKPGKKSAPDRQISFSPSKPSSPGAQQSGGHSPNKHSMTSDYDPKKGSSLSKMKADGPLDDGKSRKGHARVSPQHSKDNSMSEVREQALAAYRLLRAQQNRAQKMVEAGQRR